MASNKDLGNKGEDLAVQFLEDKSYTILERNYRIGRNEIDIIANTEDVLVFIEVKVRSSNSYGFPESFVSDEQAERILNVAEEYQYEKGWQSKVRFDIISIERTDKDFEILHFEDAIQ